MQYRSNLAAVACLWLSACVVPVPVPMPAPAPAPSPPASAPVPTPIPVPPTFAAAPDPAVLGEWRIEQARSEPLLDRSAARLNFGPDGQLSGNGSCNVLRGRYSLVGNALELGPVVTTRRACATAAMEQEDRVLTALERAVVARVPPTGYLTLFDADGAVLLRAARLPAQR
ncbi:META domain-containing protein [Methylibium sp.]|uniref:META domain-containing protein n=1 Tax=Methylibium sp. TaxID=2067992 RepID=UPI003D15332E